MTRKLEVMPSRVRLTAEGRTGSQWDGGGFFAQGGLVSYDGTAWRVEVGIDHEDPNETLEFHVAMKPTREDIVTFCYKTARHFGYEYEGVVR